MKKYFNEKGEQFRLAKGTIKELKDYQGKTSIFLTQDETEENGEWYMTFMNRYKVGDTYVHTVRILWNDILTTANLAKICGYDYDEDGNYVIL